MHANTDADWEEWGRRNPYFAVITQPKFRRENLSASNRIDFFESGRVHAEYVLAMLRLHVDSGFNPMTILDFGCGVGRVLAHFAAAAQRVVGLDVSASMLEEARANCHQMGLQNVEFIEGDDSLSALGSGFDLIHSFIVFQHIPEARGLRILRHLIARVRPGGCAALHILYAKGRYSDEPGEPFSDAPPAAVGKRKPGEDPEMQMNPYDIRKVMLIIQRAGVTRIHAEYTDHGGEYGMFLFFRVPA